MFVSRCCFVEMTQYSVTEATFHQTTDTDTKIKYQLQTDVKITVKSDSCRPANNKYISGSGASIWF